MSADDKRRVELAALQALLDGHGGDSSRWPGAARRRFDALIATDGEARRLVAEARALDTVLMTAPVVSADRRRALTERIVSATEQDQGRVIDLREQRRLRAQASAPRRSGFWQAAGMLAASLIAGVIIGVTGTGSTLGDLTSLFGDTDTLTATMSLAVDGPDEDVL